MIKLQVHQQCLTNSIALSVYFLSYTLDHFDRSTYAEMIMVIMAITCVSTQIPAVSSKEGAVIGAVLSMLS
jgi:hypothetical protein